MAKTSGAASPAVQPKAAVQPRPTITPAAALEPEEEATAPLSVLTSLQRAQSEMAELIGGWEERVQELEAELSAVRGELAQAQAERERLVEDADVARRQVEHVLLKSERQELRTAEMAARLKEIHRGAVTGDVYNLTLQAALDMTSASRGLYLTVDGEGRVRVRAAEKVADYPALSASPYLTALAHQVLQQPRSFICHTEPEPSYPSEQFQNCVAARIPLLRDLTGILLVGDRADAEFDEEDVEMLLVLGEQAAIAVQNAHVQRRALRAYASTFNVVTSCLEHRASSGDGADRVVRYARQTARRLGLTGDDLSVVTHAAALRDIGKLGISDGLLHKPGPLTPEEWALVRSHARLGHEWVRRVPALRGVADAILRHHERWDGTGYPSGLRAENIPLAARIVAVADAYGAMTSHRSYRAALTPEAARRELERASGTQFDPRVTEAFLAVIEADAGGSPQADDEALMEVLPGFAHVTREAA